jgi:hypothetical protein
MLRALSIVRVPRCLTASHGRSLLGAYRGEAASHDVHADGVCLVLRQDLVTVVGVDLPVMPAPSARNGASDQSWPGATSRTPGRFGAPGASLAG